MYLFSKRVIYSFAFLLVFFGLRAQDVESLKHSLAKTKEDTSKINLFIQLIENIDDDQVWPLYNDQMLTLAQTMIKNANPAIARKGKKGMADAYNNKGYLCNMRGEIPAALEFFGNSLIYQQELGDKAGEAEILGNMGVIYYQQKDKKKALDFYLRSLKLREELGDKEAIANSLVNIGNLCYDQHDVPKALYYTQRSLKLQEEIGDKRGMSYSLNNLAGIYYQQNKFSKALEYYVKSLNIRKEIEDKHGIAASYNNIATTYLSLGRGDHALYKLSRIYCDSSLALAKILGFPDGIRNGEHMLSRLDSTAGNFAGAFAHFKQFMIYKDSVVNDENHQASVRSQIKYDFDKKEAVLQEQRNKERAVADERHRVNKIRLWFFAIGLILVIIFAIYIYRSLMANRRANKIITAQKELVEQKNHIIEEKQKEIIDSINYAKRIQNTLLAHEEFLQEHLPQHFVYFDPKDIVSGDFYWAASVSNGQSQSAVGGSELQTATANSELFYLAVCDSTGHGVPGAFMSLLNIGFLAEAIKEKNIYAPHEVFNYVRTRLVENMSREGQKDGFDGILICIEKSASTTLSVTAQASSHTKTKLTYAASNNAPVIVRDGKLIELDCDRMPVGKGEKEDSFRLFTFDLQPSDLLYLFTDGYADQFGGPKGKKFMSKRLNQKLMDISSLPLQDQHVQLKKGFEEWKNDLEQVDDVCVIGIRL
jgi:serine phosphatase RsbU (regulator of sigma subunit)